MQNRDIAEQKFSNYLYEKGFIGAEDDLTVRRLDFGQNWTVLVNNRVLGNCDYNARINRFVGLKLFKARTNRKKPVKSLRDKGNFSLGDLLEKKGDKLVMR